MWRRLIPSLLGPSRPFQFVTSFNVDLFHASGRRCLETFRAMNPDCEVVAYVEASSGGALRGLVSDVEQLGVRAVSLRDLPLLRRFLDVARDVIPESLGGDAPEAMFPGDGPESGDVWFRKQMYRWFRKVVALDHAKAAAAGSLFWIDCDCYCLRPLSSGAIADLLGGVDLCLLKGRRKVCEAGFVGYNLGRGVAGRLIDGIRTFYMSGEFREHPRWDDCYALDLVRAQMPELRVRDLAKGRKPAEYGHVMRRSLLAPYIEHDKGLHGRRMRIVS